MQLTAEDLMYEILAVLDENKGDRISRTAGITESTAILFTKYPQQRWRLTIEEVLPDTNE